VASLVFGSFALLVTPPGFGVDESTHIVRVIELVQNVKSRATNYQKRTGPTEPIQIIDITHIPIANSGQLKKALASYNRKEYHVPIEWGALKTNHFGSAASYGITTYWDYVYTAKVLKHFKLGPIVFLELLRAVGLVVYIAIVALALVLIRHVRWGMAFLAATPAMVYLASTINADGFGLALSILVAAIYSRLIAEKKLTRNLVILALATLVLCSLVKVVYGILGLILLAIPLSYFGKARLYAIWAALLAVAAIVPGYIWSLTNNAQVETLSKIYNNAHRHADYNQQLIYLHEHPVRFLGVIIFSLARQSNTLFLGIFNDLGWANISIPFIFALLIFLVWFLSPFTGENNNVSKIPKQIIPALLLMMGLTIGAVEVALYTGFTPVGAGIVEGVQGRYFLPLLPTALLALSLFPYIKVAPRPWRLIMRSTIICSYALAILALAAAFSFGEVLFPN
jgi:uncharacterized membrane protein